MDKIDFKKDFKKLFNPSAKEPEIVTVPRFNYLMVDGQGDPNNSQEFQDAVGALYSVTYTLKFELKHAGIGPEYSVAPLDGLWWKEGDPNFDMNNKADWLWTAMILQPDHITNKLVQDAITKLKIKKPNPALAKLRLEPFEEGLSAQIMYFGPYSEEGPTIQSLHQFAKDQGYELRGKHHEIYLGDPRKSAPEKLKTIIRQPIALV